MKLLNQDQDPEFTKQATQESISQELAQMSTRRAQLRTQEFTRLSKVVKDQDHTRAALTNHTKATTVTRAAAVTAAEPVEVVSANLRAETLEAAANTAPLTSTKRNDRQIIIIYYFSYHISKT